MANFGDQKYEVYLTYEAESDILSTVEYIKHNFGEMTAEKYRKIFTQAIDKLSWVGGSMPIIDSTETFHENIRRIHAKRYVIYYKLNNASSRVIVVRVVLGSMDRKKLFKKT